jgi:hypothetical protein
VWIHYAICPNLRARPLASIAHGSENRAAAFVLLGKATFGGPCLTPGEHGRLDGTYSRGDAAQGYDQGNERVHRKRLLFPLLGGSMRTQTALTLMLFTQVSGKKEISRMFA